MKSLQSYADTRALTDLGKQISSMFAFVQWLDLYVASRNTATNLWDDQHRHTMMKTSQLKLRSNGVGMTI